MACGFCPKANKICFDQSQFYRCTDLHATYKLAPAGTLRFAQSHRREAHNNINPASCKAKLHYLNWVYNN